MTEVVYCAVLRIGVCGGFVGCVGGASEVTCCALLCMLEAIEEWVQFRGFDISMVADFSLQFTTLDMFCHGVVSRGSTI